MKQWTLSIIANFSTDDVFEYIGTVVAGKRGTFSNFERMVETYRESNGGDCMILMYDKTGSASGGSTSCGSRFGCHICLSVKEDKSMANMIVEDKYKYMVGLNNFRNYLSAKHHDLSCRSWLSRRVNPEDGSIKISPVAYSPKFCLEMLQYILTNDLEEREAARDGSFSPRFQVFSEADILAVDILWLRYGYFDKPMASLTYHKIVVQGERYYPPVNAPIARPSYIPSAISVPFCDDQYHQRDSGFYDTDLAVGNPNTTNLQSFASTRIDQEFSVDAVAASMFFEYEAEDVFNDDLYYGVGWLHYFFRLGVVALHKGGHSEWDRMLKVSNQLRRHKLAPFLSNPNILVEKLTAGERSFPGGQQSLLG